MSVIGHPSIPLTVYIGWDSRESVASDVCAHSIRRRTRSVLDIKYLKHRELRALGLFARPWLIDGTKGNFTDLIDGRGFTTEFSHTRFLVPALQKYKGWALFLDADMIFLSDVKKLFSLCDDKYAIMCVKHQHQPPANSVKMDGRMQNGYWRKNWSSFMLINCAHPSNAALTVEKVNLADGADLHALSWLRDNEIGHLPTSYNYISGVSPKLAKTHEDKPIFPDVIHYTEGGPWFEEKKDVQFSDLWIDEYEEWCRDADFGNEVNSMPKTIFDRKERP